MGIGDWGLGIGDWAQSPIPNPQSPIPKSCCPYIIKVFIFNIIFFQYYIILTNMENSFINSFTVYFILIISMILLVIDSIELYRVIESWNINSKFSPALFAKCLQTPLITRVAFSIYSIITAFCISFMALCLVIDVDYFITKLLSPYLKMIYHCFGPILLTFTIVAFHFWKDVAFTCAGNDTNNKVFSVTNMFTIVGSFIIALLITLGYGIYEVITYHVESVLQRSGGSSLLRKAFWASVHRERSEEDYNIIRNRRERELNFNSENTNNNLNNTNNNVSLMTKDNNNESRNLIEEV